MSCDTVRRRHNHPQAGSVFERGAIRKHAQYLNEEAIRKQSQYLNEEPSASRLSI